MLVEHQNGREPREVGVWDGIASLHHAVREYR